MMRRGFFVPLSAGSAAMYLLFAGCTLHVPESSPPPPPPPTIDPFCAALAEPFCESMFACCVNSLFLSRVNAGLSVDECKKNWSSGVCLPFHVRQAIEGSLADGDTVFNPARLDACVAHLKPLVAGGYACVAPPQQILMTECLSAFEGQLSPGDKCTWDADGRVYGWTSFAQCKDGLCDEGTCVPFLKPGDACPTVGGFPGEVSLPQTCNYPHGEWCKGAGDTGTCGPREEIGAACNVGTPENRHDYECRSFVCDRTTGTCIPSATPTEDGTGCWAF
jgi:hypothetical protein